VRSAREFLLDSADYIKDYDGMICWNCSIAPPRIFVTPENRVNSQRNPLFKEIPFMHRSITRFTLAGLSALLAITAPLAYAQKDGGKETAKQTTEKPDAKTKKLTLSNRLSPQKRSSAPSQRKTAV
jgi:hypothetical protein